VATGLGLPSGRPSLEAVSGSLQSTGITGGHGGPDVVQERRVMIQEGAGHLSEE